MICVRKRVNIVVGDVEAAVEVAVVSVVWLFRVGSGVGLTEKEREEDGKYTRMEWVRVDATQMDRVRTDKPDN